MTFTITSTSTTVTLNTPTTLGIGVTKNVATVIFTDGTDAQLDKGKTSDHITLSGTDTSNVKAKMKYLNNIMDDQETITIAGLPDSNLNTDYVITTLDFKQKAGQSSVYHWNVTCERLYDNLG